MGSNDKIRIVIAEDHLLFREGLRLILKDETNFEIIEEATDGTEAVDIASNFKPDVVLLDVSLPKMDGIQAIPLIKQKSPETKILMLTARKHETTIVRALDAGAQGYLSKNTSASDLVKAINVVYNNELWVERKLLAKYFNGDVRSEIEGEDQQQNMQGNLTPREQDVLHLLIKGYTNKEIANDLFISEKTVKSHLNKVFKKLNVSRRLEAIICAIKIGL
jgi:DNA-binding NarL/FixJ family response regulator